MCALIRPSSSIPILVSTDADAEFSGRHVACTRCAPKRAKAIPEPRAPPPTHSLALGTSGSGQTSSARRCAADTSHTATEPMTAPSAFDVMARVNVRRSTSAASSAASARNALVTGGGVRPPINISTDGRVGRVLMDGTFIRGSEISKNKAFRSQREHPAILERAQKHLLTRTHVRV